MQKLLKKNKKKIFKIISQIKKETKLTNFSITEVDLKSL